MRKTLDKFASMYDQREKYGKCARKLEKLPAKKRADYEDTHRQELALSQAADRYMRELERDGIPGSRKDWGEALSYCGRQTYLLKHDQDCMKEKIRALELAKREFVQLRERKREEKSRQKSEER